VAKRKERDAHGCPLHCTAQHSKAWHSIPIEQHSRSQGSVSPCRVCIKYSTGTATHKAGASDPWFRAYPTKPGRSPWFRPCLIKPQPDPWFRPWFRFCLTKPWRDLGFGLGFGLV
jgi:hypothetical protein